MRYSLVAAALIAAAYAVPAPSTDRNAPLVARPIPAEQINKDNIYISKSNTGNSTVSHGPTSFASGQSGQVPVTIKNNLGSGNVKAYFVGRDSSGKFTFIKPDGEYQPVTYTGSDNQPQLIDGSSIAHSVGSSEYSFTIDKVLSSGRVYFADGELSFFANPGDQLVEPAGQNPSDPSANINWGFAEFNWGGESIFGNLSFIDFFGMVIGYDFKTQSGNGNKSLTGMPKDGVQQTCDKLKSQASADGNAWGKLCMNDSSGKLIRVVNPEHIPSSVNSDYYSAYIDQVWDHYKTNDLKLDLGRAPGNVTGRVNDSGVMTFDGYGSLSDIPKPTQSDIFMCDGADGTAFHNTACDNSQNDCIVRLAGLARVCAAFNRGTLLLDGGDSQPDGPAVSTYYTTAPSNQWAKIIHEVEIDHLGYAFQYDDVAPLGTDLAGTFSNDASDAITSLTYTLGGSS